MPALNDKIFDNIVEQLKNRMQADKARAEMQAIERQSATIQGRMSVLAELYQEETGTDLQKSLNQDESWQPILQKAHEKAQAEFNQMEGAPPMAAGPVPPPQPTTRPMPAPEKKAGVRSVSSNKKTDSVATPQQLPQNAQPEPEEVPSVGKVVVTDDVGEAPPAKPRTNTKDREQPIKMVIDDDPPQAPEGTPVTQLNDDD